MPCFADTATDRCSCPPVAASRSVWESTANRPLVVPASGQGVSAQFNNQMAEYEALAIEVQDQAVSAVRAKPVALLRHTASDCTFLFLLVQCGAWLAGQLCLTIGAYLKLQPHDLCLHATGAGPDRRRPG